jgi:hypothetical protein
MNDIHYTQSKDDNEITNIFEFLTAAHRLTIEWIINKKRNPVKKINVIQIQSNKLNTLFKYHALSHTVAMMQVENSSA